MSTSNTYRLHVDTSRVDGDVTSLASRHPKQLTVGYDLLRAIEELRSVPVLRWPDEVRFDDIITFDVDDRAEYSAVTTNVAQPEFSNHTTNSTAVSAVSSRRSCTVKAGESYARRPTTDLSSMPAVDQPGRTVGKHVRAHGHCSSAAHRAPVDHLERLSDNVFVDELTPIDSDLLIDDVYEREMDELEQLGVEADDVRDWINLLPESTVTDGFDQRTYQNSTDIQTNRLSIESFTDRRLTNSSGYTTECCFRSTRSPVKVRTDVHPQNASMSDSITYSSNVSSIVDTSAEELFEEIVESLTDTVSEDDSELDGKVTADGTNTKFGNGKLKATVCHQNIVSDTASLRPSNRLPRSSNKQDALEQKRQKDLTVSLESTLNECLKALSRVDASVRRKGDVRRDTPSVERLRRYDTRNSDAVYSWSSSKTTRTNSEDHCCVTSSSSGFQSDLMDVDINEEFDANAAFDDADLEATRPTAESTSLDSLLGANDDDDEEPYSTQTVIRRPAAPQSQRFDNHSAVSGFTGKTTVPQTTIKLGTAATTSNRTETTVEPDLADDDGNNKKNSSVVACTDDKSPLVEVISKELITQEIVLNIVLPRRSKKSKKRAAVDGCVDRTESVENSVISRKSSDKAPHRDFHIHRIVRCSDADDRFEEPLAISEDAQSQRQKSVTEPEEVENGSGVNDRSLVARYVGGPLSVEMERNTESATTERLDDDTNLRVTRRNRIKVLRAPGGSGGALFNAPVASVGDVVDDVRRTLDAVHQRRSLPSGVRVTCDAVERKSSTSLPVDDVTVVRRVIVDDSDRR